MIFLLIKRKVSGVLIENTLRNNVFEYAVIGIGVNVNQTSFGDSTATSLSLMRGAELVREDVFIRLIKSLDHYYTLLQQRCFEELKNAYMNKLIGVNQLMTYRKGENTFKAEIVDIEKDGRICLLTKQGVQKYAFKEVIFEELKLSNNN